MIKQLLFFISCIFLLSATTEATQNIEIKTIVFDFGGVIAKANRAQMVEFFTSNTRSLS